MDKTKKKYKFINKISFILSCLAGEIVYFSNCTYLKSEISQFIEKEYEMLFGEKKCGKCYFQPALSINNFPSVKLNLDNGIISDLKWIRDDNDWNRIIAEELYDGTSNDICTDYFKSFFKSIDKFNIYVCFECGYEYPCVIFEVKNNDNLLSLK